MKVALKMQSPNTFRHCHISENAITYLYTRTHTKRLKTHYIIEPFLSKSILNK